MTQAKHKILIVEDSDSEVEALESMLESDYVVSSLDSSFDIVSHIKNTHPDLLLINPELLNLPLQDICNATKRDNKHPGHVIFLSPIQNIEDSIWAYKAGADDFISKPYDPEIIRSKIQVQVRHRALERDLESSANKAQEVANQALKSTSEMGILLHFMGRMVGCEYYDDLGVALLDVIELLGFNAVMQIRGCNGAINLRCANESLDAKLLNERQQNGENILALGDALFMGSELVSVLIKNIHDHRADRVSRLKSKIPIILESATVRVKQLDAEVIREEAKELEVKNIAAQPGALAEALDANLMTQLSALHQLFCQFDEKIMYKIDTLQEELDGRFRMLDLLEDQEEQLVAVLNQCLREIYQTHELSDEIKKQFNQLLMATNNMSSNRG